MGRLDLVSGITQAAAQACSFCGLPVNVEVGLASFASMKIQPPPAIRATTSGSVFCPSHDSDVANAARIPALFAGLDKLRSVQHSSSFVRLRSAPRGQH